MYGRMWIKQLRERHNLTQEQLASKMDISQNHLSNIESRKRQNDLKLSHMLKLAEIFGISLEDISRLEKGESSACQH